MNTINSCNNNKLIIPVSIPERFKNHIPQKYLNSKGWKTFLSEILASKVTELELIGAMRRSVSSRQSEDLEETSDPGKSIPVEIRSDFDLSHVNRNALKKKISLLIGAKVRLEDLLLACEKCLKNSKKSKEVAQ
jgi:hypothetical protein